MDYYDIGIYCGYGQMDLVWSLLLLLRPWMGHGHIVMHVVYLVELPEQRRLCPIFCENIDLDKWDTIVWYQVTQNPQEFRGLTGCQRDPRIFRASQLR